MDENERAQHDAEAQDLFVVFLETLATDPGVSATTSCAAGALAQHLRGIEEPS